MKNFAVLAIGLMLANHLAGQAVPNPGFESWAIRNLFNEPGSYTSGNVLSYLINGNGNVKKVADAHHGIFAIKLETVTNSKDTIQGFAVIGNLVNQTIYGGIPYTESPDSLTGYIKHTIVNGDTASITVIFKKTGEVIGLGRANFIGSAISYQRFSIPINFSGGTPDTMAVLISSSRLNPPFFPGSVITVDSLKLVGAVKQIPNASFETWNAVNSEEPENWKSLNFLGAAAGILSVTKTNDSHGGNYGLQLQSILSPWNDTVCILSNGKTGFVNSEGGMRVNANPQKLKGFYKYMPNGPDTAIVIIRSFRYNLQSGTKDLLDSASLRLPPASVYTPFEITLSYKGSPVADTVNIIFSACNLSSSAVYTGLGSILIIDDIDLNYYATTAISSPPANILQVKSFPNPVSGKLNFNWYNIESGQLSIEIYDITGNIIKTITHYKSSSETFYSFDVADIADGVYFYRILLDETPQTSGKFIIVKEQHEK